jgi:hypothetical protein
MMLSESRILIGQGKEPLYDRDSEDSPWRNHNGVLSSFYDPSYVPCADWSILDYCCIAAISLVESYKLLSPDLNDVIIAASLTQINSTTRQHLLYLSTPFQNVIVQRNVPFKPTASAVRVNVTWFQDESSSERSGNNSVGAPTAATVFPHCFSTFPRSLAQDE